MNIIWRGPIPIWNSQTKTGNYEPGRQGQAIKGIVIHTMVTSLAGADATFHNPARVASAHYGISYDGMTVYQWVKDTDTSYQCGRLDVDSLDPFANRDTLGIEHDDQGRPFDPRPDGLYATSAQLVALKCRQYGIPIDRAHIRKHSEVSVNPTGCPDSLDIERIVRQAAALQEEPMDISLKRTLVRLAYLAALGREPESQTVLDSYANSIHDNGDNADAIVIQIGDGPEADAYRTKLHAALAGGVSGPPGPPGPVGPPGPSADTSAFAKTVHEHTVSGTAS